MQIKSILVSLLFNNLLVAGDVDGAFAQSGNGVDVTPLQVVELVVKLILLSGLDACCCGILDLKGLLLQLGVDEEDVLHTHLTDVFAILWKVYQTFQYR